MSEQTKLKIELDGTEVEVCYEYPEGALGMLPEVLARAESDREGLANAMALGLDTGTGYVSVEMFASVPGVMPGHFTVSARLDIDGCNMTKHKYTKKFERELEAFTVAFSEVAREQLKNALGDSNE